MLKKLFSILLMTGIIVFAACSKSTDTTSSGNGGNNNNNNNSNNNNQTTLPPGWYTDTTSFHVTGTYATLVALQSDGKIIGANPTQVARLNRDGSLDQTFTPYKITTGEIHALCVDKDDKIYVAGNFQKFGGSDYSFLVRLNKDGSIDNTLTTQNYLSQGNDIKCLALRSDGKLMVGGKFNFATEILTGGIASIYFDNLMRLNTDGSVDISFFNIQTQNPNYLTSAYITAINILPGHKMYVAGNQLHALAQVGTPSAYDLIRINDDGSLDRSFMKEGDFWLSSTGGHGVIGSPDLAVKALSDGTVLLAGYFSSLDNNPVKNLLHISDQGNLTNSDFSGVNCMPTDICQFSKDEILITAKNPPTTYFGDPSPGLSIKGLDGKDLGAMKDGILAGDMYSIIKESDSTALIAGKMQLLKINQPSVTVAFARVKKHL
ncbi:MAG: delta-60 repeat domain-containing protein [Bacteroidetes bacterium]|nr:delta-60 repeat domain-containing protein [Bacteroidota bacterium]